MSELKFRLKQNDQIEIRISGSDPAAAPAPKELAQGILRPAKPQHPLARRFRKEGIKLRIFDIGQFANEDDLGFVFNANPALIVNPISSAYALNASYNYAADFNAFVLAFPYASWSETFMEISNPYPYGAMINELFDVEKDADGFPISLAGAMACSGGRAFQYFNTGAGSYYKVTATPSFAAPEISFVLDKSCNVFLMPLVMRWTGRADRWLLPRSFSYPRFDYLLNGFYKALTRAVLDAPNFEAEFGMPFFRFSTQPSPASMPLYPLPVRNDWRLINTLDPDASLIEVQYNGAFNFRNHESHLTKDPYADFPTNETSGVYINPTGSAVNQTFRPYAWLSDNIMPAGLLCGAIQKEDDWYFIWSKIETPIFSAGGYMIAT